jgi:hypothetical protein
MEPRHTPRQSPERRRLLPWYGTFANVSNGRGLCARNYVRRYDQKDPYTLILGAAYYGFRCDAGETMSGGDATPQSRLAQDLVPDTVRSQWYMAIHDILPTKERLYRIALADTANSTHCGQVDTPSYRLIDCGAGKEMWRWTQGHLATMLRTHSGCIPDDWPLRPRFSR